MVAQSVRLAMVRSMRMLQRVKRVDGSHSLRAYKLSCPYACTAVVTLRQSELGEILEQNNHAVKLAKLPAQFVQLVQPAG